MALQFRISNNFIPTLTNRNETAQTTQSSTASIALPAMSGFPTGEVWTPSLATNLQYGEHQKMSPKFTAVSACSCYSSLLVLTVTERCGRLAGMPYLLLAQ